MNDTSIKKRPLKKYLTVLLGIVIISVFVANVLVIATAGIFTPKPASITILYDPTDTVLATTAINIQNYIGEFTAVHLVPVAQAKNLLTLIARISNPIVYVFHGNTAGWKVGNDFVTNTILSAAIEKSPSAAHFFVACNSDVLALMISNKYIGSLLGITDAQVGTLMIEEQLLSYFSTHGLTHDQYTQLDTNLQTYIKTNGITILSRMIHPVQPLSCIQSISPLTTSSLVVSPDSYYGPSGFYVTSNNIIVTYNTQDQIDANTPLSGQVTAANNILAVISVPGVKFTMTAAEHSVTGNAVYSYVTQGSYGCLVWDSIVNPVAFTYYSFSVSGIFDGSVSTSQTTIEPTTATLMYPSSSSGSSFYKTPIEISSVNLFNNFFISVKITPSVDTVHSEVGGTLKYATGVSYTTAPTNGNCQSITTQWINSNVQPNAWQSDLYAQIDVNYEVNIDIGFYGYTLTFNLGAGAEVGDKFTISADANNNLYVSQNPVSSLAPYLEGTFTGGITGVATVGVKILIVPVALVSEDGGYATYSGIYIDPAITLLGANLGFPYSITYQYHNSIPDTSTNTLISELAAAVFG